MIAADQFGRIALNTWEVSAQGMRWVALLWRKVAGNEVAL
jgi:hypothetical protein